MMMMLIVMVSPSSYSTSLSIMIMTIISVLNRLKERVRSEMMTQLGMYHFYCHLLYGRVTETAPIDTEAEKLLFAAPQAEGNYAVRTMTSNNYYLYRFYYYHYYFFFFFYYYKHHLHLTHQLPINQLTNCLSIMSHLSSVLPSTQRNFVS